MPINANNLINTIIDLLCDIEPCYRDIPHGSYIGAKSQYREIYQTFHAAERCISMISNVTDCQINDLYRLARIARKWYAKTSWEKCLPDNDAERLLICIKS